MDPGQAVGIARHEVRWVVTEFGATYLHGHSLRERAVALIELAHPDHRERLLDEARAAGLVPAAQKLRSRRDFPDEEIRTVTLRDGRVAEVRPSRTSDAVALQRLFHHLRPEDIYTRFFQHLRSLTTAMAEHLCSVSYDSEMAFVAVVGDPEGERIIATSSYVLEPESGLADVAYLVDPEYAGYGLATTLQDITVDYARRHQIAGFHADVLVENLAMLKVLHKAAAQVTVGRPEYGSVEVRQVFAPA